MQELSNKIIRKYNYIKAKEFVDDLLFDLKHLGVKLMCLLPPDAGRKIDFLDKVNESRSNSSKQERYVEKKEIIEQNIKKELEKIADSLSKLSIDEKLVFEELYIYQNTDYDIEEKLGWSHNKINHIKKSMIIKIALSKGEDYEK